MVPFLLGTRNQICTGSFNYIYYAIVVHPGYCSYVYTCSEDIILKECNEQHKAAGKHTMPIYYGYKPFSFVYSTKINSLLPVNK